jgi:hypothetical protein
MKTALTLFFALALNTTAFAQTQQLSQKKADKAIAKRLCGTGMLKEDVEDTLCQAPKLKTSTPKDASEVSVTTPIVPVRDFDKECQGRPSNEPFQHCVDRLLGKPVSNLEEDEKKAVAASQAYRARAASENCQNLRIGSHWDYSCVSILYPGHVGKVERWGDGRVNISIRTESALVIYFVDKDGYIENFVRNED